MTAVAITAGGLVTAVGFNAAASCAAIRAGIRGVRSTNLFDAVTGEPIPAGKVDLPQWWEGLEKLAELVAPAISECLGALRNTDEAGQIPILLGVPGTDRPHRFAGLEDRLLGEIEYRLGLPHHPLSRVGAHGQVSATRAIHYATTLITKRSASACVVAGVDSLLRQNVVNVYAERRRVMTSDNSNGFFPGEAGSAVLVSEFGHMAGPQLEVLGIGFGREAATIETEEPCRAEGLTRAIKEAVAAAGIEFDTVAFRVNDLNGEHYKFKEATIAVARMEKRPQHTPFDIWHPIEFVGEIGAAVGPAALTVTLTAGAKGYAPGDVALLHFSNDDGERAAIVTRYSHAGGSA